MKIIKHTLLFLLLIGFCTVASGDSVLMEEDGAIGMSAGFVNDFSFLDEDKVDTDEKPEADKKEDTDNDGNTATSQNMDSPLAEDDTVNDNKITDTKNPSSSATIAEDGKNQSTIKTADPKDPNTTVLINEWLRIAEPPINAIEGAHTRYEPWGRVVGSTKTTTLQASGKPDDVGGRSSSEYLWSMRDRLDSVNHCKLGEYVTAKLGNQSIAHCKGRYKEKDTNIDEMLAQGRKEWREGKLDQAIGNVTKAQKLTPDDQKVNRTLTAMKKQKNDIDKKLKNTSVFIQNKKLDEAEKNLSKASAISSKYVKYIEMKQHLEDARKRIKKEKIAKVRKQVAEQAQKNKEARQRATEEAKKESEAKKDAQNQRQREADEKRRISEKAADTRRQAEEQAKRNADARRDARIKAAEEKKRADSEARKVAEERIKEREKAKRKAEAEKRVKEEDEARRRTELLIQREVEDKRRAEIKGKKEAELRKLSKKRKLSTSHPLIGRWDGYVKQGKKPKKALYWDIISVNSNGIFIATTTSAGKKERFQGSIKGNKLSLTSRPEIHNGNSYTSKERATWDKHNMTMKGIIIPYMDGKNMLPKGYSINFYLKKKEQMIDPNNHCSKGTVWNEKMGKCIKKELKPTPTNYGNQCPKRNPGNKFKNKFDTNNNSKDGTYILCNYFKDGVLQYQAPYRDGKINGVMLKHQSKPPHRISQLKEYKNGKIHGILRSWMTYKNHYYQESEVIYIDGKKSKGIRWHNNGNTRFKTTYDHNGKASLRYYYNKSGKLTYCTEWSSKGRPMKCKTNKVKY